ncbi:hypothetical protein JKG47_12300 [Acidithiobacillus sp. MC6.1]|nr:hypothetical protein [Acidithiobacillus sp. MC6.1]
MPKPEATERARKGRKPKGDRPMTSAERAKASRDRRRFPMEGYSGKQVSVMLSGPAHSALDDLLTVYSDKSQKEIIDMAIVALVKSRQVMK